MWKPGGGVRGTSEGGEEREKRKGNRGKLTKVRGVLGVRWASIEPFLWTSLVASARTARA